MALYQQLLRWRSTYDISDDAFDSLQIILAASERNETPLDNTMVLQSNNWLMHTTHSSSSLPDQSYFGLDPFINPSVVDSFLTSSLPDPGLSTVVAPANDHLLTGNFNSLSNGQIENLQDLGPLHQFDNYQISSTREIDVSNISDDTVDVLPFHEQAGIYHPGGPQPSAAKSTTIIRKARRKGRAARGTFEQEPSPPCIKCWLRRRKCNDGDGERCQICISISLPAQVCIRRRFANNAVSSKWKNADYRAKLEWEHLKWISTSRSVVLTHRHGGPTYEIKCREFAPVSPDQTRIHWKTKERWNWMETTAFGLGTHNVDLDQYITAFSEFYLTEVSQGGNYISEILRLVKSHSEGPLVRLALKQWTANRLLMEGWQLEGGDLLGMPIVTQSNCPLYNKVPAPRVLENQLDRHLESYIVNTEQKLLKMLENAILQRTPTSRVDIFLSVAMILHIIERDIWRTLYWVYHEEQDYKWRHPSTPIFLIGNSVQFSKLLLAHIRCANLVPDEFVLQLGRFRTQLQDSEKAYVRYNEIEESSLDSTLSSLAIVKDIKVVAEVHDFVHRNGEAIGSMPRA